MTKREKNEKAYRDELETTLVQAREKADDLMDAIASKIEWVEDETIHWGRIGDLKRAMELMHEALGALGAVEIQ